MKLTLFSILLFISHLAIAQSELHIYLDSANVVEKKIDNRAGIGVRKSMVDETEMQRQATRSLSELLTEGTALQIKSMGQGAQSSVSFRGTSSNHTQVLWNGISINSPQLGGFDFSQVPVYFIDQVTLTHGSATPYATSGALGGSINFSGDNAPIRGIGLNLISEYASNNTFTQAATFKFTKGAITSTTRAFYQQSDNNYKYLNKVYSNDHTIERRAEADYKQGGILQELTYRWNNNTKLAWNGWLQKDNRSLPQSIIVNATATEQTQSANYRTSLCFSHNTRANSISATVAYLRSEMDYTRQFGQFDTDSTSNINNSIVALLEYKYKGWNKLVPTLLLNYRHDNADSDNFADRLASRNSYTAKMLLSYYATNRLQLDATTTAQGVDTRMFGTYSLSGRYAIIHRLLELQASHSYNHRVPTLNDLYWNPGGNPDLEDETSIGWDATLSTQIGRTRHFNLSAQATYYHMNVDNWIMWIPKGNGYIWEPVNFTKVRSTGAEFNISLTGQTGALSHLITGVYTYARSVDKSNNDEQSYGKQIAYVPRNRWNAGYRLELRRRAWFHYNATYTGVRFTSADEEYQTNAYTLHNFEAGYRFKLGPHHHLSLSCKIENAFNAYYESTQYYPMPLRMTWCRLQFAM